jgi:predicted patatin/cPLA2 family phospholipase
MRGVVTAAMATALEHYRAWNAFDAVYGVSAGAITGAFFVARQASMGTSIFYDTLTDERFFSKRRMVSRTGPAMSLEYLIYDVLENQRPLNYDEVLRSECDLHVFGASTKRGAMIDLGGGRSKAELQERLRAAARIPLVAGPPVELDGDRYYDAGLFDSVPHRAALEDGHTHLLVLLSRPADSPRPSMGPVTRTLMRRHFRHMPAALFEAVTTRSDRYNSDIAEFYRMSALSEGAGPFVYAVSPPAGVPVVRQFEQDRTKLVAGAISGARALHAAFGNSVELRELLCPVDDGVVRPLPLAI